MWLLLLSLHLVGFVGYNLLLRRSLKKDIDPWTLATAMATGIALPMLGIMLIYPVDMAVYTPELLLLLGAAVLLGIALHTTNVRALQHLEAGTYSILFNLRIIFTTVLGVVFLGESIVPLRILGGVLIFLAVLTVKQGGDRGITARGVQWGLAASVVISVLNMTEKHLIGVLGYLSYAAPAMLISAVLMWVVLLARKAPVDFSIFRDRHVGGLMAFRALSAYGLTLAFFVGGLLSVSTYISSLGVVAIVILGALFLNEKEHLTRKLLAAGVAVLGLTAILIATL